MRRILGSSSAFGIALLIALAAGAAKADVMYDYTGAVLNNNGVPTDQSITGDIVFANPLPAAAESDSPAFQSFSFTDGTQTITNTTPNVTYGLAAGGHDTFITNSSGQIIAGEFTLSVIGSGFMDISSVGDEDSHGQPLPGGACCAGYLLLNQTPGTWSGPLTVTPPPPSGPSLYLSHGAGGPPSASMQPTSITAELTLSATAPDLPNTVPLPLPFNLPDTVTTLQQAATALGYTAFDWQQLITSWPSPSALYQLGNLTALTAPPSSFLDPPINGYTYPGWAGNYPFYYNPLNLTTGCALYSAPSVCDTAIETGPIPTLNFYDSPADPCLASVPSALGPGGTPSYAWINVAGVAEACSNTIAPAGSQLAFTTSLVGILPDFVPGTDCTELGTCVVLGNFTWTDTFNGDSPYPGSGGIVTASDEAVNAETGVGGITVVSAVPEPSSATVLLSTVFVLVLFFRRKNGYPVDEEKH